MKNVIIREVRDADLPALVEMVQALALHHGDVPTVEIADLRRDCCGGAPWLRVLVAETQGRLVGYVALCPLAQLQFGVRGMDLHHLFAARDVRGQGIGRGLIDAALVLAQSLGCRYVTVGTHPDNALAARIYQSMGFDSLPPPGPRFRVKI